MLPIADNSSNDMSQPSEIEDTEETTAFAFHAHDTSSQGELAQYHHQSLWSPPTSTILKAIQNNQLTAFPGLTPALLKHLPPSTATHKDHMRQQAKGIRSTRSQTQDIKDARLDLHDMNPSQEACAVTDSNLFCFAALADVNSGVIYTDLPGRFPVMSVRGMQYIFVCYACLLYTSPSPRDRSLSRMPSSA